jgi:hypothetical protein
MGYKAGKNCKVTLGASTVVGIGTWKLDGITADQMDTSAFGDNWKSFEFGMKDGGTLTFSGLCDPADTTGQQQLQSYNIGNTDVTSLRLYVDNTSYYVPCQTTSYYAPGALSTGIATVLSWVNITSFSIGAERAGMLTIDFTAKISGCMALV